MHMELEHNFETIAPRPINLNLRRVEDSVARVVSRIGSPPVSAVIGIVIMASAIGGSTGWLWALIYLVLSVPLPALYVVWKVRRGEITDFHIQVREQRLKPYGVILICTALGLLIMHMGHAPQLMLLVAAAGWLQIALLFVVNLWWKISAHCAAAAGIGVLAIGTVGVAAWPLLLSVPVIGWSRVRLQRHSVSQTIAGTGLGLLIAFAALYVYRQG